MCLGVADIMKNRQTFMEQCITYMQETNNYKYVKKILCVDYKMCQRYKYIKTCMWKPYEELLMQLK